MSDRAAEHCSVRSCCRLTREQLYVSPSCCLLFHLNVLSITVTVQLLTWHHAYRKQQHDRPAVGKSSHLLPWYHRNNACYELPDFSTRLPVRSDAYQHVEYRWFSVTT